MLYFIYKAILTAIDLNNISLELDVMLCGGVLIALLLDCAIVSGILLKIAKKAINF